MDCRVCNQSSGFTHIFHEMMFGTREAFPYFECDRCGCIQIVDIPQDLEAQYVTDYYSFTKKKSLLRKLSYTLHFGLARYIPRLRTRGGAAFRSVMRLMPGKGSRILDVGCGSGELVHVLRSLGYEAYGIDAFANDCPPFVRRADLASITGLWDLIMFHHSLEHMNDQLGILKQARKLLKPTGVIVVRIPIVNWAWTHYRNNWVQLDAPRHLLVHSLKSFQTLTTQAGMEIFQTVFDSGALQHTGSELYKRNIPLKDASKYPFKRSDLRYFRRHARELNVSEKGDQAAFYLRVG